MKEEKFDVKSEYSKLKYKLPRFEELDEEFEISNSNVKDLKNNKFLIRNIRRRVNDKIIFYCRIIEGLLYPNQSNFISMFELKSFKDNEKEDMDKLYKRLMQYERESLMMDVNPDEKKEVDYINNLWKNWPSFKKDLIKITEKMKSSWQQVEKPIKDNYFG